MNNHIMRKCIYGFELFLRWAINVAHGAFVSDLSVITQSNKRLIFEKSRITLHVSLLSCSPPQKLRVYGKVWIPRPMRNNYHKMHKQNVPHSNMSHLMSRIIALELPTKIIVPNDTRSVDSGLWLHLTTLRLH